MDDIDRALLRALLDDGRLSYQQLANQVHLSPNSTADRVRRLRQSGVLAGYRAELDLRALGRQLVALSDVKLRETIDRRSFERDLEGIPQVLVAVHITGEYDYQRRVACRDTDDFEGVLDVLRDLGAREVQSRSVLGEIRYDPARLL